MRRAITHWYKKRYDVELDPESEAIVTIGSKEGLSHLALATVDRGDAVLVPNPAYPIHPYGFIIAGADIREHAEVVAPPPVGHRLAQTVQEQRAVGQAGEGIVQRVVEDLGLGLLAAGDVGLGAGQARALALEVPDHQGPAQHEQVVAPAVPYPVLALEVG